MLVTSCTGTATASSRHGVHAATVPVRSLGAVVFRVISQAKVPRVPFEDRNLLLGHREVQW